MRIIWSLVHASLCSIHKMRSQPTNALILSRFVKGKKKYSITRATKSEEGEKKIAASKVFAVYCVCTWIFFYSQIAIFFNNSILIRGQHSSCLCHAWSAQWPNRKKRILKYAMSESQLVCTHHHPFSRLISQVTKIRDEPRDRGERKESVL